MSNQTIIKQTMINEAGYKAVKSMLIKEGSVVVVPENVKRYKDGKVVFDAYLQEADIKNQNRRRYRRTVLHEAMMRISKKINSRGLTGELDHPISDNQLRQTTVLYKESSHLIREWGWEGNFIKGTLETLPYADNGKIMSGLIYDRIPIGFSLRGLADVEDCEDFQDVLAPLVIITYDCVSEPSHAGAILKEIRTESVCKILEEAKHIIRLDNGKSYTPNALDILVERKLIKLAKRYM